MNVRREIDLYALPEDRVILNWLFDRYHWASQWGFVATCTHQRYGTLSYETNRVWAPTTEGRVLYTHLTTCNQVPDARVERELQDLQDAVDADHM